MTAEIMGDLLRGRLWDDSLMGVIAEEWWSKHGPPEPPGSGRVR
ncbi:MAG TPA: hypothetical protein VJ827_08455 [Rubrobacter sp.]|nr:hypothetical protein [Rubrobacter sp.]